MEDHFIIIGTGQAGIKAAETLRRSGYDGRLSMFGAESWFPYQRPPLSKGYLKGELDEERLFLKGAAYFDEMSIALHTNCHVAAIKPQDNAIELVNGENAAFSKLLLATGTRARTVPLPGAELDGVFTLRGIDDTRKISKALAGASSVAIIGGGYIGMEFAAVARAMGKDVCVIEYQDRILKRSVAPEISDFIQNLHLDHGVNLLLGQGVQSLSGKGQVSGVTLLSGVTLPADLVLIAAGAVPNSELAEEAGLSIKGGGIGVDETCQTSAPNIYAAGDCTIFPSARYGRFIRLESVQNASDQGKAAAMAMLGEKGCYDPVPWFWSDQYDIKLQIAGLSEGYDRIEMVGDKGSSRFSLRYFSDQQLLAVDSVNDPRSHMMARRDIASLTGRQAA